MVFILEALPAKHGDSLLLHFGTEADPGLAVIDGGPAGVLNASLLPRLQAIHKERGEPKRLAIDLGMVSHIDDDHVNGIAALTSKMVQNTVKPPLEFARFWHNSFNDLLDDDDEELGTTASLVSAASIGTSAPNASAVIASVGQGREVRKNLEALGIGNNSPFKSLIVTGHEKSPFKLKNLKFTVVAPLAEQVEELQKEWAEDVKKLKKDKPKKGRVAEYLDESVPNLSSLVFLVEDGKKRMLLTGDARGDHTLEGLEKVGLLKKGKTMKVDILKCPHHGSDRNVDHDYFERILAKHYVISADGKHGNPDIPTLEMISAARPDDDFTIHFTHPLTEFADQAVAKKVKAFFAAEKKKGRGYEVVFRAKSAPSITIEL
jgi:hypothetical protein